MLLIKYLLPPFAKPTFPSFPCNAYPFIAITLIIF